MQLFASSTSLVFVISALLKVRVDSWVLNAHPMLIHVFWLKTMHRSLSAALFWLLLLKSTVFLNCKLKRRKVPLQTSRQKVCNRVNKISLLPPHSQSSPVSKSYGMLLQQMACIMEQPLCGSCQNQFLDKGSFHVSWERLNTRTFTASLMWIKRRKGNEQCLSVLHTPCLCSVLVYLLRDLYLTLQQRYFCPCSGSQTMKTWSTVCFSAVVVCRGEALHAVHYLQFHWIFSMKS